MLRWYGYIGLLLIALAELNFHYAVQPFAEWYIVIVWSGYILFVDSLVFRIKGRSLISSHTKEFVFIVMMSLPFWLIFEFYNVFTHSWHYVNYVWYVHIFDFMTILPAVLETFSLLNSLNVWSLVDTKAFTANPPKRQDNPRWAVRSLVILGLVMCALPVFIGSNGFLFMWMGLAFLLDPLNYLTGSPSLLQKASVGMKSTLLQISTAGLIMGFFWEFWNYQAYPKWFYSLPSIILNIKLFEMPVEGYVGYIAFGASAFLFYSFFRHIVFKDKNVLLSM